MELIGLQKLTLLDDPGHVACTVFVQGCNFRCPFCHNSELIPLHTAAPPLRQEEFFAFLKSRVGVLDSVCLTGGEPLLWQETENLLMRIRELGYRIKLDTNGSFPDRLERVVHSGLVDCVAMDIKNSPDRYAETIGWDRAPFQQVQRSAAFLLSGEVEYEFRTTVARELHDEMSMDEIGRWLRGANRYFLQNFVCSQQVPDQSLTPFDQEGLARLLQALRQWIPNAQVRG